MRKGLSDQLEGLFLRESVPNHLFFSNKKFAEQKNFLSLHPDLEITGIKKKY